MKRITSIALSILAVSAGAFAQSPEIDNALLAAPAQLKAGATVIKWKADYTYDTLRKGTNKLVCYDKSGMPTVQDKFMAECTSIDNLDRVAQNLKFEAIADAAQQGRIRQGRGGWNAREARIRIGLVPRDGRRTRNILPAPI